ncbi:hypothetical protein [Mycobacterium sp. 141]|uniref:hypothetical protein n=1 Tax=Mycobacterium sp. 141 TaxID=1120797 RepID=UPI0003A06839|nr:hypothetical protein [Mycobacterium sp. 141]
MTGRNEFVLVEHPPAGVALVTLNRPERMNAMTPDTAPGESDQAVIAVLSRRGNRVDPADTLEWTGRR